MAQSYLFLLYSATRLSIRNDFTDSENGRSQAIKIDGPLDVSLPYYHARISSNRSGPRVYFMTVDFRSFGQSDEALLDHSFFTKDKRNNFRFSKLTN